MLSIGPKINLVPRLKTEWTAGDYLGALMMRAGMGRSHYRIRPGLYRTGDPDSASPVLVTANYKLTLDHLRKNLKGINSWILVLDTDGVNVWCAAGKGTFGTEELVDSVKKTGLATLVNHRKLILPQLGAPGIQPGVVKSETGFSVIYGPVEARDLPRFLENGLKAKSYMRKKVFSVKERFAVSFTHFIQALPAALLLSLILTLIEFFFFSEEGFLSLFLKNMLIAAGAAFSGSLLSGVLLPFLPGRAFSIKGLCMGILFTGAVWFSPAALLPPAAPVYSSGKILLFLSWIIYLTLNLTGSSTYTSLSGVRKEMKTAIPLLVSSTGAALVLMIYGGIIS